MHAWVTRQAASIRKLSGQVVARWAGVEMALREAGADGRPVWREPSVPLLQLQTVELMFADGSAASLGTYQNDCRWGLCRVDSPFQAGLIVDEPDCIYRSRSLDELPSGKLQDATIVFDEGDLAEVLLNIDGRKIRFWAGEVYEQLDGTLRVVAMDESVLVQVDGQHPLRVARAE